MISLLCGIWGVGGNTKNKVKKKKQDLWLPEVEGRGKRKWRKVVERYKLPGVRHILGIKYTE